MCGYVTGKDRGPVDPHITEDSPLRESRYPYRGRKLPIDTEWDLENYDRTLVERAFQSDPELPATILRLGIRARRPGAPRVPVSETDGRRPGWDPDRAERSPLAGAVEDMGLAIALPVPNGASIGRVYNNPEPDVRSTAEFLRE